MRWLFNSLQAKTHTQFVIVSVERFAFEKPFSQKPLFKSPIRHLLYVTRWDFLTISLLHAMVGSVRALPLRCYLLQESTTTTTKKRMALGKLIAAWGRFESALASCLDAWCQQIGQKRFEGLITVNCGRHGFCSAPYRPLCERVEEAERDFYCYWMQLTVLPITFFTPSFLVRVSWETYAAECSLFESYGCITGAQSESESTVLMGCNDGFKDAL